MQLIGHRRRVILSFFAVLVVCASLTIAATAAHADGGSGGCSVINPSCTVGTGGGGGSGGWGDGGGTGGGGTGCQNTDRKAGCDPCPPGAAYGSQPPAVSQVCADHLQNGYCSAILGDILGGLRYPSVNNLTPAETAIVNQNLAGDGCPAIVTTAMLAQQAYDSITFPRPSGHRSPSEAQHYNGYPFTYVKKLWTYFWTDPATWKPLTATASAAGLTATVTAEPVSLSFDPGDGSAALSCDGPGRPWTESDGNNAPSEGACGYQYSRVTGPGYDDPITSTQTIVWKITWTGTGNTGGEIPELSTSTSGQLNVLQIKTVNR